ncbi:heme ABC exporter ATP-binding protein CcmA [Legionella sp. CNM-4043-24]|uniref:heme ABC exporter ATP-binding protein CcmA n=1 Tax=Legionella sp. CNM-4043-24 TaxID=3421646 RepID=UPI00403A8CBE
MLQAHSLSFDYYDRPLLHGLQFSLSAGCLLHLRGKNGSGKTTLLKLLAGLLTPSGGVITWNGQSVHDDLRSWQGRLCFVGHRPGLSPHLSIRENGRYDQHWQGQQDRLELLLQQFSLLEVADQPCASLSAGQLRRAALLRLAMTDAQIWLLDEPLVALDEASIQILTSCLCSHLDRQGLIVMTSHQALPEALSRHEEFSLS